MPETRVLASGVVERIGIENGSISYKTETADFSEKVDFKDHAEGLQKVANLLMSAEIGVIKNAAEVDAVGHRVVHGLSLIHI